MSGSAVLAMLPRVSQKPLGPTWAPAGNEAHLAELRSTAGSCLGRFIGLLLFVEFHWDRHSTCQGRMPIPKSRWAALVQTAHADRSQRVKKAVAYRDQAFPAERGT